MCIKNKCDGKYLPIYLPTCGGNGYIAYYECDKCKHIKDVLNPKIIKPICTTTQNNN